MKLVNHLTWQSITSFRHVNVIRDTCPCIIYQEAENSIKCKILYLEFLSIGLPILNFTLDFTILHRPFALFESAPCGMVSMCASSDGRYLATLDRDKPKIVWIWDIPLLCLTAVLVQRYPVKCKRFFFEAFKL